MSKELHLKLESLTPLIYVVTDEEDRLIKDIHSMLESTMEKKKKQGIAYHLHIWSSTLGLMPFNKWEKEFENQSYSPDGQALAVNDVLIYIYRAAAYDPDVGVQEFFIFLDADKWLQDFQVSRRVKDIALQLSNNNNILKSIVFVGSELSVPARLMKYFEVIYYDLPDEKIIGQKINDMCEKFEQEKLPVKLKAKKKDIVRNLRGLTMYEIQNICFTSCSKHQTINLKEIIDFKKASLRRTKLLNLMDTDVTFDDIGGLERLKEWSKIMAGGWTDEGIKFGLPPLKGVLLLGIAGTGKSLFAKAIGNEWKLPVIFFDPSKLFSQRVGESEANMHKALKIVESMAPCVVVIDEIEKGFAGIHSSTFSDAGTTARVIGVFLTWFQEVKKHITIVATCNAVQYLPPELISRFTEIFFVDLPEADERKEIIKIHLGKVKQDYKEFNLKKLAEFSVDLTGREIEQAVEEAMHLAFYRKSPLTGKILYEVFDRKIPILKTMEKQIRFLRKWVGYDSAKGDGVRARFASKRKITNLDDWTLLQDGDFGDQFKSNYDGDQDKRDQDRHGGSDNPGDVCQ